MRCYSVNVGKYRGIVLYSAKNIIWETVPLILDPLRGNIFYACSHHNQYFALIPYFDNPEDVLEDDAELVILRAVDDSEDSYLEVIEDDDEFNKVAAIFTDRLSETFEIEE